MANIVINLARGIGPWVLTDVVIDALGQSRVTGFELLLLVFWSAAAIVLAMLASTIATDQLGVEAILCSYALENTPLKAADNHTVDSSGEASGEGSFVDDSRSWYSVDR